VTYEVQFGRLVKWDLAEAYDWYEEREEGLGETFLDAFEARVEAIRENPRSFPVVHRDVRRSLLRRFPYMVLYRVESLQVTVIGCLHGRRDPRSWQERL
jgi:plasmid stabilization system protein ParE